MDEAHIRLAGYLNVDRDEIHFGPSTSQNTYVLAHTLCGVSHEGDEIIVTNQDHEANSGAWRRLTKVGLSLTFVLLVVMVTAVPLFWPFIP